MEATQEAPEKVEGHHDASLDNPMPFDSQKVAAAQGLSKDLQEALKNIRNTYKEQFQPKRSAYLRRIKRAFEYLKNNPYISFNSGTDAYDTIDSILNGADVSVMDAELYKANDNAYQMLCLAFIACLSPEVPKARFQPMDADDEEDLVIARKASDIQADNERRNKSRALQKLELLYQWCSGGYFAYTRNIVDANRAGTTKRAVVEMQQGTILSARYICPQCGAITNEDQMNALTGDVCPKCGAQLDGGDYYEGYDGMMPVKVKDVEEPNNMTAFNIYDGRFVDADPDAFDLYESPILDLEAEMNVAAVRAAFPLMFKQIQETGANGESSSTSSEGRDVRQMVTNPGPGGATTIKNQGTYSRCWIQPWAYYILEDLALVKQLEEKFPEGVKYVSYDNGEIFLQALPESMTKYWTWCGTITGLGLYPFGVGDVALDLQRRLNNNSNVVDAYCDRLAFGTILYDADVIDWDQVTSRPLTPGNGTPVNRTGDEGQDKSLEELLFQPEFHVDSHIFEYGDKLLQLMQVLVGVQPQSFGGSDPNVKTKGGQEQALQTALGRMKLFWDQIREEHAGRAENSVKCTVRNMGEQHRIVMAGDTDSDWKMQTLLRSELTGDFKAYADSDDGFPSSFQEIQDRIMQLMGNMKDNPFLGAILSDPDTQKTVARYILPDVIKLPNDAARTRLKLLVKELSESAPTVGNAPGPDGQPVLLPSKALDPDFDDVAMAVLITKSWLQSNVDALDTNPDGFNNVLALLRQASMLQMAAQAKQQLVEAAQGGGGDDAKKGPGEGGPGGPPGQPPPPQ